MLTEVVATATSTNPGTTFFLWSDFTNFIPSSTSVACFQIVATDGSQFWTFQTDNPEAVIPNSRRKTEALEDYLETLKMACQPLVDEISSSSAVNLFEFEFSDRNGSLQLLIKQSQSAGSTSKLLLFKELLWPPPPPTRRMR